MRLPARLLLRPALAALLPIAALGACDRSASPAEEREELARRGTGEITLAVVWPWAAHPEVLYGDGLEMAVAEVNAAGGVHGRPLRLLREDDGESVNEGLRVAQRLAENPQVTAVIGHLQSYVSVPAAAVYDQAGLVMLAPTSTAPGLTAQGYSRVFRSIFTDEDTGTQMADFAASRGFRNVAIYYVRNPYGRMLANAFEERAAEIGLTVAARASHDPSQDQEGLGSETTLREWARMELDAIFMAGQVPIAGRLIAQMRREGIDVPVMGGDAMSTPALISVGGEAVEGTIVTSTFHPSEPRPEVQRFVEAFRARHGVDPDPSAAVGYDAVKLLAHAIERAGSPAPADVARELHALRGWRGLTGEVAFDERGNLLSPRVVKLVVRGGRFEYLPETALVHGGP